MQRRRALIISGAAGFGIGGAMAGAGAGAGLFVPGFALMGALGGYALAWARPERRWPIVGGSALGFFGGLFLGLYLVAVAGPPAPLLFVGAIAGALGGLGLALGFASRRALRAMPNVGAIGFGLGFALLEGVKALGLAPGDLAGQIAYGALTFGVAGALGGAGMGFAVSWAEATSSSSP